MLKKLDLKQRLSSSGNNADRYIAASGKEQSLRNKIPNTRSFVEHQEIKNLRLSAQNQDQQQNYQQHIRTLKTHQNSRCLPPQAPKTPTESSKPQILSSFAAHQPLRSQRDRHQQAYRSLKTNYQGGALSKSTAQFTTINKNTSLVGNAPSSSAVNKISRPGSQLRRSAALVIDKSYQKRQRKRSLTPRRSNIDASEAVTTPIIATDNYNVNFKVCARIRPLLDKERTHVAQYRRKTNSIIQSFGPQNKQLLRVFDSDLMYDHLGARDRSFAFHEVFNEQQSNAEVFSRTVQPLLGQVREGYNATCFAYGMTGAGKTFTMFGGNLKTNKGRAKNTPGEPGIADLAVEELLKCETGQLKPIVTVSFLEIYNEQVKDLLWLSQNEQSNLSILEDPARGVMVQDLSEYEIENVEDLRNIVKLGNERRTVASTSANQTSSRSHALLVFNVVTEYVSSDSQQPGYKTVAKLQIVDLAGSERAQASDNRGQRMIEGANINKSLLALGNCINALTASDARSTKSAYVSSSNYVCYRDSKLTRLLKDSLGGNTKTVMLACVSQFYASYEETLNTLKYAQRACKIKNEVSQNLIQQQRAFEAQLNEETEVMIQKQTQLESKRNQELLGEFTAVITKLQSKVQQLEVKLSQKDSQSSLKSVATQTTPAPKISMPSTPLNVKKNSAPQLKDQSLKQKTELTEDEWVLFECVKTAALQNASTPANPEGSSLREFFTNVHYKISQNLTEKNQLNHKVKELKIALQGKQKQLEQTEEELRQINLETGEIDSQLMSMKHYESQLLTQNVKTNQHLLQQIESTANVNSGQFKQLRSYMSQTLPEVLSKVIRKIFEDQQIQKEKYEQQLSQVWKDNQSKDQELQELRSQLAQLQLSMHQQIQIRETNDDQTGCILVQPNGLQQNQPPPQQASNHQQQTLTKQRISSKKLCRYLSNPRNAPDTQKISVTSRKNYIPATTPISRVDLTQQQVEAQHTSRSHHIYMGADISNQKLKHNVTIHDSVHSSSLVKLPQKSALAPSEKKFRSYAQVRNESKQRMIESQRSGEAVNRTESEGIILAGNFGHDSQRKHSSTNQAINSIEKELQRHRETESLRLHTAIKEHQPASIAQDNLFKSSQPPKLPILINNNKSFKPDTSSQQYATTKKRLPESSKTYNLAAVTSLAVSQQVSESEKQRQKPRMIKVMDRSSDSGKRMLRSFQLREVVQDMQVRQQLQQNQHLRRSAYVNDSEDEMTQMSCGMNLRETLPDNTDGSLPCSGGVMVTEQRLSAMDQDRSSNLSLQLDNNDPSSKRVQKQLRRLGMGNYSMEELDFYADRQDLDRPSERLQRGKPFNDKIHDGDSTPLESNYELETPKRDIVLDQPEAISTNDAQKQAGISFISGIIQPSEPSEFAMNELEMQTTRQHFEPLVAIITDGVAAAELVTDNSAQSDRFTCNLRSQNGSPKINQEAMRQVLGRDLSNGNRLATKNMQDAISLSPQETHRTNEAAMQFQFFPQTTKNVRDPDSQQPMSGPNDHSSQAWEEQSSSAIMTFAMDVCQENNEQGPFQNKTRQVTERTVRVTNQAIRQRRIGTSHSPDSKELKHRVV